MEILKIKVQVLKVDEFISKKGTSCAYVWCHIDGGMLPMFKLFVYESKDNNPIAKAKEALQRNTPLLCGIGCGSDLNPRLEVI